MVSFLTDTVVCGFSLYHILAYFLIYSCIGWCLDLAGVHLVLSIPHSGV